MDTTKKKTYRKADVHRLTGLTESTIKLYTKKKLANPTKATKNKGRGNRREYTYEGLVRFMLVKELAGLGLQLKHIRKIIIKLKEDSLTDQWKPERYKINASRRMVIINPTQKNMNVKICTYKNLLTDGLTEKENGNAIIVNLKKVFEDLVEQDEE